MHRTKQCTNVALFAFGLPNENGKIKTTAEDKNIKSPILLTHSIILSLSGSMSLTSSSFRIALMVRGPVCDFVAKLYPCWPKISANISPVPPDGAAAAAAADAPFELLLVPAPFCFGFVSKCDRL